MIGRTISHYKITEKLGEDGMGEVYVARDTRLSGTVASKVPRRDATHSPEHPARFAREARTVA